MSYYEKWLAGLIELAAKSGLVTHAEIDSGEPQAGSSRATPPLTAEMVPAMIAQGSPAKRDAPAAARFKPGQRVRARNINPTGHTRLPRYARGKPGIIMRDHGVFVFLDARVQGLGDKPQHVYSVRFMARDLWGQQAPAADSVYLALWDDHLEAA
jgi:nitrile hydratase subunit beta